MLGCYRDVELSRQHPLAETLGQLAREPVFRRETLRGLTRDETQHFIETVAGTAPPGQVVEAVFARTEGNPFFMTEIIRLMTDQGDLTFSEIADDGNLRIPEGVREVIGRRLNRLSDQCNQVLTTASVIGRQFDFGLLRRLIDNIDEDRLLSAVDEAVSAQLIEEVSNRTERFQFSHALIQQTLAEELTTTRRVRLHARVGESLEELYGPEAETHAAELAHHFAEAEAVSGTDKLVRYSLMAGQRALAAHAYEEAVAHIERGLEAKGVALTDTDPAVDGEAAALLFCLGQAQAAMSPSLHQLSDATNSLERAFQFYLDTGDADQAVAVAEYHLLHPSVMARMASMISRTFEMVPPDSHHAGRILPAYGYTLFATSGEYREAQEAFGRALVIAERVADETLQMRTLARAAEAAWWNLQLPDIIEYGRRASELSGRVDDPAFEVHARQYLARALAVTGESEAAQLEEATVLAMTESLRDRNRLVGVLTMRAESCFFRGEWEEARALIDRQASSPRLLSTLAVLEHEVGDFDRGAAIVDQLIEERSRTALSLTGFT